MSAADRTKVLEAAQKHLAKGNYDKAIGEFRKIVEADPADVRTWLKIGDLYTRKGAKKEAIETYAKVAYQYGEQGFFLKAVAVYKQILKLDPARLDIELKLAEMYEMLQLVSDALATYEHVAAGYARSGDIDRALATLSKMTDLDPENIPVRIKYAEALSKAGRTKDAATEFEVGGRLLKQQGRLDDFIKVAERLLFHRPEDIKLARELAKLYLDRTDPKRALAKLQLCFKADAKDTTTLELLAEAFNQLGQLPKTISVYREVARLHLEAQRHDERMRTLRKILELDPGDGEARQALAQIAAQQGSASVRRDIKPPASAVVEPSRSQVRESEAPEQVEEELEEGELDEDLDVLEGDEDLIIVEEDQEEEELEEEQEQVAAAPQRSKPPGPSVPPDVQREAQIARLLTECDVFLRYGLRQKVVEQLHAVLEIEPMHVEARERLKDVHLRMGNTEEAIGELLTLADILAEEESAAAVLYLREILELDPSHADARERLSKLTEAKQEQGAQAPEPIARDDQALDELAPPMPEPVAAEDGVLFVEDDQTEAVTADEPLPDVPPRAEAAWAEEEEDEETPEELLTELPEEEIEEPITARADAIEEPRRAIMPPPSKELLVPKPGRLASESPGDPLAPMSPQEFDDVPLRPSAPGSAPAPSPRQSMPPGEVEEILDEADFFLAQGLFEEARGTLSDALSNHPGHPLIEEKLRDVAQLATNAANARAAASMTSSSEVPDQAPSREHALSGWERDPALPVARQRSSGTPPVDQSFELAERLAEELDEELEPEDAGSDMLDVEQVFAQFKKGVEQQVGLEDTETHFDLGIAYKEMGLLDDAMNEFRLCVTNPQRVCIAETMIGLCHIEKGDVAEAISHFKKGLYADTKTDREELGLYFELGNAYELLHDPKEALYYYQKVQKRDPKFRDVGSRIQNLSRPQAPAKAAALGVDDIDAAFDDLVGED